MTSLEAFDQEIENPELVEGLIKMRYYTYILLCRNGKYYVGHTSNLKKRFNRHLSKSGAKFTAQNTPIKILWKQKYDTEIEAIHREKQIKGWNRIKKENLINGHWK